MVGRQQEYVCFIRHGAHLARQNGDDMEFKIGDRVRVVNDRVSSFNGRTGTIVDGIPDRDGEWLIELSSGSEFGRKFFFAAGELEKTMTTFDILSAALVETRHLLSTLRRCDSVNTPDAWLSLQAAIEHTESALNTLRVAAMVENNRLVELAERMGV